LYSHLRRRVQYDILWIEAGIPRTWKRDSDDSQGQRSVLYSSLKANRQFLFYSETEDPWQQESNEESNDRRGERRYVRLPREVKDLWVDLTLHYSGDQDEHKSRQTTNLQHTDVL